MTPNRPPTLPREVRVTIEDIEDIEAAEYLLGVIKRQVLDVHVLAHEQPVSGEGGRAKRTEWDNLLGDPDAKDAWRRLASQHSSTGIKAIRGVLTAHAARVDALFSGPGADASLRGTLLGDERGNGAQRELTEALKAQGRRAERGEYLPDRSEPQPRRVPGAG